MIGSFFVYNKSVLELFIPWSVRRQLCDHYYPHFIFIWLSL